MGMCQVGQNWPEIALVIIILTVTFYLLLREYKRKSISPPSEAINARV